VAGFIGTSNLIGGSVDRMEGDLAVLTFGPGERVVAPVTGRAAKGDQIEVSVRPEKIDLYPTVEEATGDCVISGVVTEVIYHGTSTNYTVKTACCPDLVVFDQNAYSAEDVAGRGDTVYLTWNSRHSYPIGA
jgi:spermidine/putrescine transport system ATP-binding protein